MTIFRTTAMVTNEPSASYAERRPRAIVNVLKAYGPVCDWEITSLPVDRATFTIIVHSIATPAAVMVVVGQPDLSDWEELQAFHDALAGMIRAAVVMKDADDAIGR